MLFRLLIRVEPIPGESRVPQIIAGNVVPQVLATIFVFARCYTRAVLTRSWGADDTCVAISWLSSLALCIVSTLSTQYGSGHHLADIPPSDFGNSLRLTFSTAIIYLTTLAFTKISICLFYLRLFADRISRNLVIGTVIWIVVYTTPCLVTWIFQCDPIWGYYDYSANPKCINTTPIFFISSIYNIVTDAWLIFFIAPKIWSLTIPRKQKAALFFIITLGWLVIIAAIVRVVRTTLAVNEYGADITWEGYDVSIWSCVEVTVGLFCVSAPAIKPLVRRYAPGFFSSTSANIPRNSGRDPGSGKTRGQITTYIRSRLGGSEDASDAFELHSKSNSNRQLPLYAQRKNNNAFGARSNSRSGFLGKGGGQSDTESMENVLPVMESSGMEVVKSTTMGIDIEEEGFG